MAGAREMLAAAATRPRAHATRVLRPIEVNHVVRDGREVRFVIIWPVVEHVVWNGKLRLEVYERSFA